MLEQVANAQQQLQASCGGKLAKVEFDVVVRAVFLVDAGVLGGPLPPRPSFRGHAWMAAPVIVPRCRGLRFPGRPDSTRQCGAKSRPSGLKLLHDTGEADQFAPAVEVRKFFEDLSYSMPSHGSAIWISRRLGFRPVGRRPWNRRPLSLDAYPRWSGCEIGRPAGPSRSLRATGFGEVGCL